MKPRCQAAIVVLALLLAAAVGWQENGRRGVVPARPATSTVEVNVSEKVQGDGAAGNVTSVACDPRTAGYPADAICGDSDARQRARLRHTFKLRHTGSWPKLDPCPVHLREESERGPRMCLDSTLASASTPRDAVWSVQTDPAEQAFLDLIGRPDGAPGDVDVAAAVKVLRFLVQASIMGAPADLAVLRKLSDEIDGEKIRRVRVVRAIVRAAKPFAERPEPTDRAVREGFERFPMPDARVDAFTAIWELRDLILEGEQLAAAEPRIHDSLRAMRRIVAVYELREELSRVDPRFGELDAPKVYELLDRAVRGAGGKGRGNVKAPGVAAKLSADVRAFDDEHEDTARKAFERAITELRLRRCCT